MLIFPDKQTWDVEYVFNYKLQEINTITLVVFFYSFSSQGNTVKVSCDLLFLYAFVCNIIFSIFKIDNEN